MLAFIVSLIIPSLIWGPFIPDLIVSISSLIFLVYVFKNKQFFFFINKPLIIFFTFCVYCILISLFIAKDMMLSFESSLFYFRIGVFACFIWYLIEQNKKILNHFYYIFVFCFTVLVLDSYLQYYTGFNVIGFKSTGIRISSFFGDELILGSFLSRLYPLAFALFLLRKNNKLEMILLIILFILTSSVIYISGERSALYMHIMSLIFILIFVRKIKYIRFIIPFSFAIIVFILSMNNDNLKYRMLNSPIEKIGFKSKQKYIFTSEHDSLIKTAYNMFLDKPVFGHGPKMFRIICSDKKYATGKTPCMNHPHHFYVQLLAETGIIGFMFLFTTLIYILYCATRQLKTLLFKEKNFLSDYQICLIASFLITVFPFSTNGNFFNNWLAICYSLPVGFYLHSIYGKNKEEVLKE